MIFSKGYVPDIHQSKHFDLTLICLISVIILSIFISNYLYFGLIEIIFQSFADAYLQVSVFVASTLFIFYGAENLFGLNLSQKINNAKFSQVPICAGLGCLPGCGGALLVISQYTSGSISFGSVVAVLTSTMGDAAFLLLATEPQTGLFIIFLSFFVGSVFGWFVNLTHPENFLKPLVNHNKRNNLKIDEPLKKMSNVWLYIFMPGLILGVLSAFQYDLNIILENKYVYNPASVIGFSGALMAILLHIFNSKGKIHHKTSMNLNNFINKSIADTNFVTIWVVMAFLAFEIPIYVLNFNMENIFNGMFAMTPLIAIIIGFLPGCGPQIIVTSIYLLGVIPLSAQIGNSISNDGDALFPILALAPKVGIIATLYSAVPAFIVSYGYMLIFEL